MFTVGVCARFSCLKNVAPEDIDLSHPQYYRKQVKDKTALSGSAAAVIGSKKNIGQPGCTDSERERFQDILQAGDLYDAYRKLNGTDCDQEYAFSWRGNNPGKHSGRGMRIDHCIASQSLEARVKPVKIHGHETERNGFMGSDHSPIVIELREQESG